MKNKKVNKRTPFNKHVATVEKSPKTNKHTPTFIRESRVCKLIKISPLTNKMFSTNFFYSLQKRFGFFECHRKVLNKQNIFVKPTRKK